jgi:hypothetical protein
VLDMVEREARQHLYTNTKNGNREAMLNIVKRVRAALAAAPVEPAPKPNPLDAIIPPGEPGEPR